MTSNLFRALLLIAVAMLVACSGAPRKRVFPPEVRVQELHRQGDAGWSVVWRVSNFSNVPMQLASLDLELRLDGGSWRKISVPSTVKITANSVELLTTDLGADAALSSRLDAMTPSDQLRYELRGQARFSVPSARFDLNYASAVSPAPGLPGVLR